VQRVFRRPVEFQGKQNAVRGLPDGVDYSVSSLEMESNPSTDILNLKLKFVKMGMNVVFTPDWVSMGVGYVPIDQSGGLQTMNLSTVPRAQDPQTTTG
jgi:hypothetical protein